MATIEVTLPADGTWVQIAADGVDYLIENEVNINALINHSVASPGAAGTGIGHTLYGGQLLPRFAIGNAWSRVKKVGTASAIIVTT